ncbi:quinone oxidoreductase-like [Centruroides sculpturatus]|uniref:quinone oxidoreductase-like n=1 Tax=Centruroides sculpturatus TaxID=218467 RepID=UPI000C6CC588|nr:quinone oxidoreductase-like [Centruroides sculpturatus]
MVKHMRAAIIETYGGPEVFQIRNDVPIPTITDKQVLVKVKYAGVNPVDTYLREGAMNDLDFPHILGKDAAGIIEAVGKNVKSLKVGDSVFVCKLSQNTQGTYADYVAVDEKETFLLGNLTYQQGASAGIAYFTAYRALIFKANAKKGETVLVHGASGAVGLAAIQMCKHYGMTTIGTAGTSEGMKLVRESGADYVFSHKDKNYIDAIKQTTGNTGIDVILEMLSNVNLGKDLEILAPRGRVMIIGCRGNVTINPRLMMASETTITGVSLLSTTDEEWLEGAIKTCFGFADGWLKPIVHRVYPLQNVGDAHHDIIYSKGAKGNLVISFE